MPLTHSDFEKIARNRMIFWYVMSIALVMGFILICIVCIKACSKADWAKEIGSTAAEIQNAYEETRNEDENKAILPK